MSRYALIILFAVLTAGTAPAQESGRVVKFRVLCFEHVADTFSATANSGNGSPLEFDFYTGGFGPQLVGSFTDGKARFFIETPGPDGKPVKKVVAEGNLVASNSQMFLLFPGKEGGMPYRIHAFDDLEKSFPMGATRVINLAANPIRLTIAGAVMPPIKPGGLQTFPQVKAVDEWNMFSATIAIGLEGDQWVPISTQSWKASDRKRDWVIAHIDPLTSKPATRLYQDIPPWLTPAPITGGG
jgi:hypothetical protein